MNKNYLLFLFFIEIILVAGFHFFYQRVLADTNSAITITVKIAVCGDGVKEGWEDCDKSDFGEASCSSLGFSSGTLTCTAACEYDTFQCVAGPSCGDGSCNGSENCANCSPDCGTCPPAGGGGGGGGGIIMPPAPQTAVIFSGWAYPLSKVSVLKDGQLAITTIAGPDANFNISLAGLSAGNYNFSVYGEDSQVRRSTLFTFPVYITSGVTTNISGIFITPTIAVDKSEVKQGDNIAIFGQSVPNGKITISINSDEEFFEKTTADKNGAYLYNLDTTPLDMGQHLTRSKAILNGEDSSFGRTIGFSVGIKTVIKADEKSLRGDLNNDNRVNLVDFSIAAYWYTRPISADFAVKETENLNGDGKIDLVDFSIMAYYWTG